MVRPIRQTVLFNGVAEIGFLYRIYRQTQPRIQPSLVPWTKEIAATPVHFLRAGVASRMVNQCLLNRPTTIKSTDKENSKL